MAVGMRMDGFRRGCRSKLARDHAKSRARTRRPPRSYRPLLEDIARQIFILRQLAEVAVDVGRIDHDWRAILLAGEVAGTEGNFLQQAFEQGMQAACANVFGLLVDLPGDLGDALD